ncbi:ribosome biogenesis protein BOP1 homolog isoform X1 [Colletes gigas]|uniref:ribosome biogenesis protein BOP1 homolog isoform X1 n=1 Tax=Colletes gigas TaxID=935657 RepID=UPI001C9B86A6|nr:ribosome biogenesis protein BOP1 homolog isoform X1 [Colletes gigas]
MSNQRKNLKRRQTNLKVGGNTKEVEKDSIKLQPEVESDSGTEDLLNAEVNNNDESTDEEVEDNQDILESDTEKDPIVFESDDEEEELEFDTDSSDLDSENDSSISTSEEENNTNDKFERKSKAASSKFKRNENKAKDTLGKSPASTIESTNIPFASKSNKANKSFANKTGAPEESKSRKLPRNEKVQNKKTSEPDNLKKNVEIASTKGPSEKSNKTKISKEEISKGTGSNVSTVNQRLEEYEYDSSDEEDIRNTTGNIPMKWYDDYDHIGYDWDGKKIMQPTKDDQLDKFLKRMENPDFWRTIKDPQTGQDVILSEADIELITRIQKQKIPSVTFDEYAPWVEWFTSEIMKMPLRKFPEHKRSFLPSKIEAKKVSKIVHALKMGWVKSTAEIEKERREKMNEQRFYMLWQSDDQAEEMRRIHKHIPAPKRHLPGHAESYNPPPEYMFNKNELKEWNKLQPTPWKRKLHFIPQKYDSLREVPAYSKYIKERFQRCLDLYLCPRALKMRLTIEPEALVPQLPSPKDLQPFPTTMSMVFKGHTDMVRSITVEQMGQYIASGGDDMNLKIWEVGTGRCVKTVPCGGIIRSVAWCPNQSISLIGVATDNKVLLINPGIGDRLITNKTDQLLEIIPQHDVIISDRVKTAVQWEQVEGDRWSQGIRIILNHFKTVKQITWHGKGDYFATVMPDGQNRSVLINQLSKRRSQLPFARSKGLIQCVLFHPIRPYLFVATQRNVRIYDLVKQEMIKKLLSNSQWISTMAIHPGGDNVLVGTYDRKMLWFDLDLSTKPYQTLRLHGTGVRGVAFHKRYPLFASGADDRGLIVSHGMVYNDLLQNPLIVPLKRLCNHESNNDFGILDVMFHPIQPWVFSAGADSTIRMYT